MNFDLPIRTRIAPSPTGDWHLGTARTALFTYLFAKHTKGDFYLRVEDTDQARLVEGSEERILETLDWLGLNLDTYPDGKTYHKQSDNLKRYQDVAHQLVESSHAYYCFAKPEELEAMRGEQQAQKLPPRYDNRWGYRDLPLAEAQKRVASGEKYVIRQKMPLSGCVTIHDLILGDVTFDYSLLDDHVLLKSDGFPTYHLAHVVDDHDTGITHVIRAAEWLPSTPKHVALHQALGWDLPEYAHVPVILGADKGKLSKRHGAEPVLHYRDAGYLPDALLNFLLLLGWSSGSEQEIFNRSEMIAAFNLEHVQPSPAVFDKTRLDWFNGLYIRKLSIDELLQQLQDFGLAKDTLWENRYKSDPNKFKKVVALVQDRMATLADFPKLAELFYEAPKEYDPTLLSPKKQTPNETKQALQLAYQALEKLNNWDQENLEQTLRQIAESNQIKAGDMLWPVRASLTGLAASPGAFEVLEILGKEESLKRIQYALDLLG